MSQIITTLPLSPKKNASLGYYLTPLIADVIASFMGVPVAHAVNVLGAKRTSLQDVDAHFAMLGRLGISSYLQWRDIDEQWDAVFSHLLSFGSAQGWVFQDERVVMVCPCGKAEFLATASTLSEIHGTCKVYEINKGNAFCLLCGNMIIPRMLRCLLVRIPNQVPDVVVIPKYAAIEWNQLVRDIAGREILISRIRETGIHTKFMGKHFNIDIDFAWKLLLERLYTKGFQCSCIVVGHKSIKHALSMVFLGSLIGIPAPRFVVSTPYLSIDFGNRAVEFAEDLVDRHGGMSLRWILGMALGCAQKEITLQSKLIYLIAHSIGVASVSKYNSPRLISVDRLWEAFNSQRIQRILSQMRRGQFDDLASIESYLASVLGLIPRVL